MDIYGLIGEKLSHSFSPDYFNKKFKEKGIDAQYKIFELKSADEFPEFIASHPEIKGLNITIPYKRSLGRFMDFIDKPVHLTGTINTIKIKQNSKGPILSGYNTDIIGFEKTLKPLTKNKKNINALILGTGGSAKSVAFVLRKLGILFHFISRNHGEILQNNYEWLTKETIGLNQLIINTTPVGMYPNHNEIPDIPFEFITDKHILYDLIYNPTETLFLKKGRNQGALCINGQKMLEIQADASWKIWKK
jgi:shikimate dehydrogenase